MTEAEWRDCSGEPLRMLAYLQDRPVGWARRLLTLFRLGGDRPNNRKLVLFACACLSRVVTDEFQRATEQAVERFVDGPVDAEGLRNTLVMADRECQRFFSGMLESWCPSELVKWAYHRVRVAVAVQDRSRKLGKQAAAAEKRWQCDLLREFFGPHPHRSLPCDPGWLAWNAGTVGHLARATYEERAFDQLPILADALEEAGCTDAAILGHLRDPGPHVRGCWVVDLLLGKE